MDSLKDVLGGVMFGDFLREEGSIDPAKCWFFCIFLVALTCVARYMFMPFITFVGLLLLSTFFKGWLFAQNKKQFRPIKQSDKKSD